MRTLTTSLAVLMLFAVGFASDPAHAQDHACDRAKRPNADGHVIAECGWALLEGDGVILDLVEAYRMLLIAGEKGVRYVRGSSILETLDDISEDDELTLEQIERTTCLAGYGVVPDMLQRLRCRS